MKPTIQLATHKPIWHMAIFALFAVFAVRIASLPFFYDDNELWMINASKASLTGILQAFIPTEGEVLLPHAFYRPITHFTWWLDGAVWGNWIPGYRITNLGIYAACSLLCFKITLHLTQQQRTAAYLACILFLFHPVHMEVLAWTAARGDLLALLFMALAFLRHLQAPDNKLVPCIWFICALLSKETALVLPLWFVCYDFLLGKHPINRNSWQKWFLLAGIAGVYLVLRMLLFNGLGGYDKSGSSLHIEMLQLPFDQLYERLFETPLQALLSPWPELASNADRYHFFHRTLAFCLSVTFIGTFVTTPVIDSLKITLCFLVVALGSYLPGSVVEVTDGLENGRMLFASSLAASIFLASICYQWLTFRRPGTNLLPLIVLIGFIFSFSLALQPWESAGKTLVELPRAVRLNFGNLTPQQELLLVNEDLGFYQGALCLSTTPSAVQRAMHLEFGRKAPQTDWKHPNSAYKFALPYWQDRRIGEDLFFARWDRESRSLIDLTEAFHTWEQESPSDALKTTLTWSGQNLQANIIDSANLETELEPGSNSLSLQLQRTDSWLAIKTPAMMPKKVRLHWTTQHPELTPLKLGLFWVTNQRPNWSEKQSLCLETSATAQMVHEIAIPYHFSEITNPNTQLRALRIDPGGIPGKVRIQKLEFLN
jgi:hypothetical protein